jgi:uncharacterized membrane protein
VKNGMKMPLMSIIHETRSKLTIDPYLVAIVVLGAFFRLYHLNEQSIWYDEAFSIRFAELTLSQIWFLQENSPPLYYVILHWWVQLFGISEYSVRLPSALFGILSIFMMYKLGMLIFDRAVGRLSSLLVALSLFHISYSQEARTYSLSVLLALLSMYFFLKLLKRGDRKDSIGYVLFTILLMYSHIYGLFIVIAQNIYFAIRFSQSKAKEGYHYRSWVLAQAVLVALFAPWLGIFLNRIHEVQHSFWISRPGIGTIYTTLKTYSSESKLLVFVFTALSAISPIFVDKCHGKLEPRYLLMSYKSYRWKIGLLSADKVSFLLLWLITPIVVPFIISLFSQPIFSPRYTIVASAAFFILAARGIGNVRNRYFTSIIVIIISIFSFMQLRAYYTEINKEQWRDVARFVDAACHKGDLLLFKSWACALPFNYYSHCDLITKKGIQSKRPQGNTSPTGSRYLTLDDVIRKEYTENCPSDDANCGRNVIINDDDKNTLLESARNYQKVWLITSHGGNNENLIIAPLAQAYNLSVHKKYYQIDLYAFDRKPGM